MKKPRFEVSTEGMRELQSGREPWQLAKELVANSWDEATTVCTVELQSLTVKPPYRAILKVFDDGKGFADIADAWTLMGPTPKRANPLVRGRFNIGEKEILSVAVKATVQTAGKIIDFPESGGRRIRKDDSNAKGTLVTCTLPWGPRQVEGTVAKLKMLLVPKGITYTVNGEEVPYQPPYEIIDATLDTVIQEGGINQPLKIARRNTTLELHVATVNGKGVLYEMGIPIQPIDCPFLVNVMQKVPMPPNRDVVRDSYLQDVYTAILNATADELAEEEVSDRWVRTAVEDKDVKPEAVKAVMNKRYGDKVLLWSSNEQANEKAREAGYEIVHGNTMSALEREAMESVGLEHTSNRFQTSFGQSDTIPADGWTEGMKRVAEYAKSLARALLNTEINVQMYHQFGSGTGAVWGGGTLAFNVSCLGKRWFEVIDHDVTSLILHELAHVEGNWHDWEYQRKLEDLAGRAVHLALEKPEVFELAQRKKN